MGILRGFGAVGLAPLVAVGRADIAKAHLVGFEEGDHEGLLLLCAAARRQPRQQGVPPLTCGGRQR